MADADTGEQHHYGGVHALVSPTESRYPSATTLVVAGADGAVLVDATLEVHRRGGLPRPVDRVVLTHGHEDHIAGLALLDGVPVSVHPADVDAVRDPATLADGFGMDRQEAASFRDEFHLRPRPEVTPHRDGEVIDLGDRTVTLLHLPGHTAGHCGLLVEPDGFLFVGDIDLTAFGPYYGDASSDLDAFEASLDRVLTVDARWYGTSHQAGVVEGRDAFVERVGRYRDVVARRDERILDLLERPRTLAEIATERIVYRPHVQLPFVDAVERRTAWLHLQRLRRRGSAALDGDRWHRTG